jgi:M6 family metalloprotease-like protein
MLGSVGAWAVPAAPVTLTLTQDDGATFEARQRGDEYRNWIETLDGYTVVREGDAWYYAQQTPDGQLAPSSIKVNDVTKSLIDIPKHLMPPLDTSRMEVRVPRGLAAPSTKALVHTQNVVVVLVNYNDITFAYTDASFQGLMFGASGSVKDYYLESTYNNFTVTPAAETQGTSNDGIIHVARGVNHPNIGSGDSRPEAAAIMSAIDASIDYSAYDTSSDGTVTADELSIVMILAGYERAYGTTTPNVWGHAWSLSSPLTLDGVNLQPFTMFGERHATHQATIGIMCHELGHLMLGLPDLYDIDGGSEGIGNWGLMGAGSWNYTGSYYGDSPAHLCAWSKATLDITTPTEITSVSTGVTIANAENNADIKRLWVDKYKIRESFLVENRQLSNYDAGLPSSGLLIYHIDDNKTTNADETHKLCDVEEADGLTQMDDQVNRGDAGDPFPGSTSNTTFNDSSTPNSKDYSGAATNVAVSNISASMATMTADFTPNAIGGTGDHVRYDEMGYLGYYLQYGSNTTIWTALRVTNDTSMVTLDGVELYTNGAATINVYIYQSMVANTPTTLLYSETGHSVSGGWDRVLLSAPLTFPAASERTIVLSITQASTAYAYCEPNGPVSDRSWVDNDGAGAFYSLGSASMFPGDLNQAALLSSTPVPVEVSEFTTD